MREISEDPDDGKRKKSNQNEAWNGSNTKVEKNWVAYLFV